MSISDKVNIVFLFFFLLKSVVEAIDNSLVLHTHTHTEPDEMQETANHLIVWQMALTVAAPVPMESSTISSSSLTS